MRYLTTRLINWLCRAGSWVLAYFALHPYCYVVFQITILKCGKFAGTLIMWVTTTLLSWIIISLYDKFRLNVFSIQTILNFGSKNRIFGFVYRTFGLRGLIWITLISCGPWVVTISLRQGCRGIDGKNRRNFWLTSSYFTIHWVLAQIIFFIPGVNSATPVLKTLWEIVTTRLTFIVT